jgi:NAD(P)-dependent dehydrogenase (short-subunit alcohol dehydrogenase family)
MGLLANKIVFLTGGAQGIGRNCALAYSQEGAHVVVADIDLEAAKETVRGLGVPGLAICCDLRSGDSVQAAVRDAVSEFGRLDAVHNNVGISSPSKPLDQTSEEEWDALFYLASNESAR